MARHSHLKNIRPTQRRLYMLGVCLCITVLNVAQLPIDTARLQYQQTDLFKYMGVEVVQDMARDDAGFLWVGTTKGVFRFDGDKLKNYRHKPGQKNSLTSDPVNCLLPDKDRLWIGTEHGLNVLYFQSDSIETFYVPSEDTLARSSDIASLFKQGDSLWMVTIDYQLHCLHIPDKRWTHYQLPRTTFKTENFDRYFPWSSALVEDKSDPHILWIAAAEGLYRFHVATKQLQHIQPPNRNYFTIRRAFGPGMLMDDSGMLWIYGMQNKLMGYDSRQNTWHTYHLPGTSPRNVDVVYCMILLTRDLLLLSYRSYHFDLFHLPSRRFYAVPDKYYLKKDSLAVTTSFVNCLFKDKFNQVWFGHTYGFSSLIKSREHFNFFPFYFNNRPLRKHNDQRAFQESADHKKLYIGTSKGDGLLIQDRQNNSLRIIHSSYWNNKDDPDIQINDLLLAPDGMLWIATPRGLLFYREGMRTFQPYVFSEQQMPAITHNLLAIKMDNRGCLWLATADSGVICVDIVRSQIKKYNRQDHPALLSNSNIRALLFDKKGDLWIGSDRGISIFNLQYNRFTSIDRAILGLAPEANFAIHDLKEDISGRIWIATKTSGLYCLIPDDNARWRVMAFNTSNGLVDNKISKMLFDKRGHLWFGTYNGISRIDIRNLSISNFSVKDRLSTVNRVNYAAHLLQNGYILLGARRGYEYFHPDSLIQPQQAPIPYLFKFSAQQDVGKNYQTFTALQRDSAVTLSYYDNHFDIELGAIDFSPNRKIQYAYQLTGADKNWINAFDRNYVSYAGLLPGKYEFWYTAFDPNFSENRVIKKILITILPPFWGTWWFKLLGLVLLGILAFILFRWNTQRLRTRRELEEKERRLEALNLQINETRLMAIRAQMNPHFIFNCLNGIQECIITQQFDTAYEYLARFSQLLRRVLRYSEKNYISLSNELEIIHLYLELETLRFSQSFRYCVELAPNIDSEDIFIPTFILQPFIENAIWHGLMNKEGEKILQISFRENGASLLCVIEDNGIGRKIAAEIKARKLGAQQFDSKGMSLSLQRLQLLKEKEEKDISFQITDLEDEQGKGTGTKVIIHLPLTITT